jgi:glycosyltransferase involved in cell wall biosynthesis
MAKVTVSMPAYNAEKYIRESIVSVLSQQEIDFELIVVDDASTDDTPQILQSFRDDPRLRWIRNEKRMGIGYCHNLIVRQSKSPFIAHVDSDDLILQGALLKLVQRLESNAAMGQAHCQFFEIDEQGEIIEESFLAKRKKSLEKRTLNRNYRRDLIASGNVINCLRTYRREVFEQVGYFSETMKRGIDYDMALRLLEKFEIGIVPEFLYCHRTHKTNISIVRFAGMRNWVMRSRLCRHLIQRGDITFISQKDCNKLLMSSLYHHVLKIDLLLFFLNRFSNKMRGYMKKSIAFSSFFQNEHDQRKM